MTLQDWLMKFRKPLYAPEDGTGGGTPPTPPAGGEGSTSLLGGADGADTPPPGDGDSPPKDGEDKPPAGDGDDDKDGDDKAPADEPVTIEALEFPEDFTPNEEMTSSFLEIVNNPDLSRAELAKQLVNLQIETGQKELTGANEAAQTLWDETQKGWQDEARAMPEIGGENLDKSLAQIKKGLEAVGATAETFQAFDLTGAGNHPEIVRVLFALTKSLAEGGSHRGDPPKAKLTQADKIFGAK